MQTVKDVSKLFSFNNIAPEFSEAPCVVEYLKEHTYVRVVCPLCEELTAKTTKCQACGENLYLEEGHERTLLKKAGKKRGALVAVFNNSDNKVAIGWSLCHRQLDTFDETEAVKIATQRAVSAHLGKKHNFLPQSVEQQLSHFQERIQRYFKVEANDVVLISDPGKEEPAKAEVE